MYLYRRLIILIIYSFYFGTTSVFCQYQISGNINEFVNLSNGLYKGLAVDKFGFVWMATDEGLYRFDGKKSTFYNETCPGGFLKSIKAISDGSLIVTHDKGVTKIIPHIHSPRFEMLASGELYPTKDKMLYPKTIFEDSKKRLWIGEDNGISLFYNGKRTKFYLEKMNSPGSIFRNFSFAEDYLGNIWAISYNGEFFRFSSLLNKFILHPLPVNLEKITQLFILSKQSFLIGSSSGLFKLDLLPDASFSSIKPLSGPVGITSGVLFDRQIYFGTENHGLFVFNADNLEEPFMKMDDLPFADIVDVTYDKNNGLWIVGSESIATFKTGFIEKIDLSANNFPVDAIFENNKGDIFVSSGGIMDKISFSGNSRTIEQKLAITNRSVTAIFAKDDEVFTGNLDGKIQKYHLKNKTLKDLSQLNKGYKINQLFKDVNQNLWVLGNPQFGLIRMDRRNRLTFYAKNHEKGIRVITQETNGNLFFGGSSPNTYLFIYDKKNDYLINISAPLPFPIKGDFYINQIYASKKGELLLASNHGLLQYQYNSPFPSTGKIKRFQWEKLKENLNVVAIAKNINNDLWVSTGEGLVHITPDQQIIYNNNAGVPGRMLSPRGIISDQRGFIWVGASKGLGLLRRDRSGNNLSATPMLQAVSVNGIDKDSVNFAKLDFQFGDNVTFHLFTPMFPSNEVKYQVKSEKNSKWQPTTSNSEHLLSSLTSGKKSFWFRSQRSGGYEWSIPLKIDINVAKPWFLSFWGLLVCIGSIVATMLIILRFLAQKRQLYLEKLKYQRLKEENFKNEIIQRDKQFTTYTLHLIQKNESMKALQTAIFDLKRSLGERSQSKLKHILSLIDFSFRNDNEWEKFKFYFEEIHQGFFEKLLHFYPDLTSQELRLCALIRLNLSISALASILGISEESVKTARFRLKKKLKTDSIHQLMDKIMRI
jgi:ligand-binding sensor domain-containing protein/DNA-binding CsgD family transcriptional regulator